MAYQKNKVNTEHPSKTVVKLVASAKETGSWPRVMLLCGKESFLVEWARDYIRSAVINPASEVLDCARFSEGGLDAYEIIATCETFPMMSEKKLVLVENTDIFSAASPRDMSADGITALTEYIPKISESTLLIFTCEKPNKTRLLYKAIAKCGLVYDFTPLDDATLSGWIAKRLRSAGKTASSSDILEFAKTCGYGDAERNYTLFNLENDLKKIVVSTDRSQLTLEDLMNGSSAQAEVNAFKLLDAALSGRKAEAFGILAGTIDLQAPSKEMTVILSFTGLLCSQLEIMTEAMERKEEGQSFPEILQSMNINEYRLKKAMQACGGKTAAALRGDLDKAFQIEKDLKSGNLDGRLALELFIAEV